MTDKERNLYILAIALGMQIANSLREVPPNRTEEAYKELLEHSLKKLEDHLKD